MSTADFIAKCVCRIPCNFVDELCDEYNLDFGDDDIEELLDLASGSYTNKNNYQYVGNMLVRKLFQDIIEQYNDVLDEEKFDWYIDGSDSNLIYDGEVIYNKEQLDAIYDKALEEELAEG